MVSVICEKADPTKQPENYRPICSLPQLYKLFTTMIDNRLYAELGQHQCPDQAGFRKQFQTTDHLMTYRLVHQKKQRVENWHVGGIDRLPEGVRLNIRKQSISEQYICLFEKMYADQRATVLTDVEIDEIRIASGSLVEQSRVIL